MRARKTGGHTWTEEEKDWILWAYGECEPEVTGYRFWTKVKAKAAERGLVNRSVSSVQRIGMIMLLNTKVLNRHDMVCRGCGKDGVTNKKNSLCYDCYPEWRRKGFLK
tara:strand:- start:3656 stop:3979 length:324 start_codon:yes stop_codon:yes gene_type:complete